MTGSRLTILALEHERPRGVDRARPAGAHDAGRLGELDDRRALDLRPLPHPAAPQHRHLLPLAVEVGLARPGLRLALRVLRGELGALDGHRGDQPRVDELDVLALHPVAVAALVGLGEALLDGAEVVGLDGQLERLAVVAQVRTPAQLRVVEVLARLLLHRRERLLGVAAAQQRAHGVDPHVGHREAERAQHAARARDQQRRDAELLGERAGVQPAGAAERDERELARVEAALDRDHPQRPAHLGVGHAHDAERGLERVEAELGAEALERRLGLVARERQLAAELGAVAEVAEQHVGVGDRRLLAALAVGGRAGVGARRARPDAQRAAGVGPGDRAAAGADGVDVDHRQLDRDARDDRLGRRARLAAEHRRDVRARPAHVEGQHVLVAAGARHVRRADDAARRAREHAAGRLLGGGADVEHAARGLHHERRRHAGLLRARRQALEVGGELRRQVGVGDGGGEALVLAELRQHLARERDVDVPERLAHGLADAALVLGVQEREQQAHRDGLDVGLAQPSIASPTLSSSSGSTSPSGPMRSRTVKRRSRGTSGSGTALGEVVEGGAVLARELDQVAEALGRDERGARAAALEQRVGGDRHPVRERRHVGGVDGLEAAHHTLRLILGRARHLGGQDFPTIQRHQIGEGSSNIDADPDHFAPFSTKMALGRGFLPSGLVRFCTRDLGSQNTRCLRMQRQVER